jgi:hypothetical protein
MAILDDVKLSLRISNNVYDTEINDLISACKADLGLTGIIDSVIVDTDTLIKRAIMIYCKLNFGYDNPDYDKLLEAYTLLRTHLAISKDYNLLTVTFTITDSVTTDAIREAYIKFWNDEQNYEEIKYTDENGQIIFYVRAGTNFKYDISADGYTADNHSDDDKNIEDVSANTTIDVALIEV